jgi:hypothetical protein
MLPFCMCSAGGVEQDFSYPTRARSLLLIAPLTIGKFVAPPRASFAVVKFHFGIMLSTPSFLLYVFLGLFDYRKPLEQGFQPCQEPGFIRIPQGNLDLPTSDSRVKIHTCWGFGVLYGNLDCLSGSGWLCCYDGLLSLD